MKRALLFIFLFIVSHSLVAQKQFIRTNGNLTFGQKMKVIPERDGGWIIFSADSLKLLRFDRCAQLQFSNQYILPNDSSGNAKIVQLIDNGCAILTQTATANGTSPVITKTDSSGNVIWCKMFSNVSFSETSCSIISDSLGFIYLVTNASSPGNQDNTVVTKMDSNGIIISDVAFDRGNINSDAIVTNDGGMLIRSGNCFIKIDSIGIVQWSNTISNSVAVFTTPVETENGYIFSCNVSLSGAISIMKLGLNGNLLTQIRTDFSGLPSDLKMRKDRSICGLFFRTNFGRTYTTMVDIDSNLNIIVQRSINYSNAGSSLLVQDIGMLNDNSPVIAGVENPTGFMFYGRTGTFYSNGCDTAFSPIQMIPEGAVQSVSVTGVAPFSHVVTNLLTSVQSIIDSQNVICSVPEQIAIGGDTLICGSRPATLFSIADDVFDAIYWSTGDNSQFLIVDQPGVYWLKGIEQCNLDTIVDTVTVVTRELVKADLGGDRYKCETNTLVLNGPNCDHCTYLWNDGSRGQSMNVRSYGPQWLKVVNDGCISVDTANVQSAKCECQFFLPNTITPNHDGINDLLKPKYFCDLANYTMKIFNRWGEMIFETNDVEQAWDAKYHNIPVAEDVYIYVVTFNSAMEGVTGDQVMKTGSIGVVY